MDKIYSVLGTVSPYSEAYFGVVTNEIDDKIVDDDSVWKLFASFSRPGAAEDYRDWIDEVDAMLFKFTHKHILDVAVLGLHSEWANRDAPAEVADFIHEMYIQPDELVERMIVIRFTPYINVSSRRTWRKGGASYMNYKPVTVSSLSRLAHLSGMTDKYETLFDYGQVTVPVNPCVVITDKEV